MLPNKISWEEKILPTLMGYLELFECIVKMFELQIIIAFFASPLIRILLFFD